MKTSAMGIIFGDTVRNDLPGITDNRTTASIPFGGRYRLIDFALSDMVHGGIGRIGVLSRRYYRSLMDHIGTGKEWDLSRKHGGLFILPPFSGKDNGMYTGNVEALIGISDFIAAGTEKLAVLRESDMVTNVDLSSAIRQHVADGNDITVVYKTMTLSFPRRVYEIVNDGVVSVYTAKAGETGQVPVAYIFDRIRLLNIIHEAADHGFDDFEADMVVNQQSHAHLGAVEADGCVLLVDGVQAYYEAGMAILDPAVNAALFSAKRPVYTSDSPRMPAKFGQNAKVVNSLVAAGCEIEGEVENCILFRGVRVAKGAKVTNSIVMNDSSIGAHALLDYAVVDRAARIENEHSVCGNDKQIVYVGQKAII